MDELQSVLGQEFSACKEGLESLGALYGEGFGRDCTALLDKFVRVNMYTGLMVTLTRDTHDRLAIVDKLTSATADFVAFTMAFILDKHQVPVAKHVEVCQFLMLYVNRAIGAAVRYAHARIGQ